MFMVINEGKHPFYLSGNSRDQYLERIENVKPATESKISKALNSLLEKLIEIDKASRYTIEQIIKHPWITGRMLDRIPKVYFEELKEIRLLSKLKCLVGVLNFLKYANKSQDLHAAYLNKISSTNQENNEIFHKEREMFFSKVLTETSLKKVLMEFQEISITKTQSTALN